MNRIICGDAIEEMKKMDDKSIDLVITSPPYNLLRSAGSGLKTGTSYKWRNAKIGRKRDPKALKGRWDNIKFYRGYGSHNDDMTRKDYIDWQKSAVREMMRLLKPDGAVFYNHKFRVQNGFMESPLEIFDDQERGGWGYNLRQMIIWQRSGGMNFNDGYFLPTYEVIFLIAKRAFKLLKGACRIGDVWKINQERNNSHPAPFPVELPRRILKSVAAKTILDPFMGSGTTGVACAELRRNFIGIDNCEEYCKVALNRISRFSDETEKAFRQERRD